MKKNLKLSQRKRKKLQRFHHRFSMKKQDHQKLILNFSMSLLMKLQRKRLTKMEVIELVATEEEESTSRIPFADTVKEKFKRLTTKLVKDWRFRENTDFVPDGKLKNGTGQRCWQRRARLVAREYKTEGKREDVFSPATSPGITKLIPILALINSWSIYSLDVKDAFLQVPQRTSCLCKVPEGAHVVREMTKEEREEAGSLSSFCSWKLRRALPGQRDAVD